MPDPKAEATKSCQSILIPTASLTTDNLNPQGDIIYISGWQYKHQTVHNKVGELITKSLTLQTSVVTSVEISLRGSGTLADSDGSLLPRKSHGGQTIQAQDSTLACKKNCQKTHPTQKAQRRQATSLLQVSSTVTFEKQTQCTGEWRVTFTSFEKDVHTVATQCNKQIF